jgi:hypothetical protein
VGSGRESSTTFKQEDNWGEHRGGNEQLARLLHTILTGKLNEAELRVGLRHAYHHLNVAWNIRRVRTSEYANLTQEQFEEWGKYPSDIDEL